MIQSNQVCTLLLRNLALVKVKFSTAHSDFYSVCVNEVMITVRVHVDIDVVFENLFACSRLKKKVIHLKVVQLTDSASFLFIEVQFHMRCFA